MSPNKKKSRQKKKGSAAAPIKCIGGDANLNAQVLEALTRLADSLARLDEAARRNNTRGVAPDAPVDATDGDVSSGDEGLAEEVAAMPSNVAGGTADGKAEAVLGRDDAAVAGDGTPPPLHTAEEAEEAPANDAPVVSLNDADGAANESMENAAAIGDGTPSSTPPLPTNPTKSTAGSTSLTSLPALPLSHWRTLPLPVSSAYKVLREGAEYVRATSTKYTLVGKVDSGEGGNLAIELCKGAELIGTGTLLLYSESCGSSRSLRRHAKVLSRAVLASVISLVKSFDDGLVQGRPNDGNNVGAQRTGAVWSACDNLEKSLPRGNRAAMRRELMLWSRDCNESIGEFEEMLALGPCDDGDGEEDGEGAMIDKEQYSDNEIKVVRASVNLMKCSKNVLGLVLEACECVGEGAEKLGRSDQEEKQLSDAEGTLNGQSQSGDGDAKHQKQRKDKRSDEHRKVMFQWISNLHEMARTVGEGVTDFGILLYPSLDSLRNEDEFNRWQERKPKATDITTLANQDEHPSIPSLGATTLGLQLEHQLHALLECVTSILNATSPKSGKCMRHFMSEEVMVVAERLRKGVKVRCKELEEALAAWD